MLVTLREREEMKRLICIKEQTGEPYVSEEKVLKLLETLDREELQEFVLITDHRKLARCAAQKGLCCIGVQKEGDNAYFDGAEVVTNSLEELDDPFFRDVWLRFRGLPVPVCETERLILRESREEDFEALYDMARESGNDTYTETMPEDRGEAQEQFLSYIHHQYRYYGFGLWTVLEKRSGRIVGRCGLSPEECKAFLPGTLELGYLIGRRDRRKGYAYEACRGIMEYASDRLEYSQIVANIHQENFPSQKLAEKLGFSPEKKQEAKSLLQIWKKR